MVEGFTFPEDLPKDIAAIAKYNGLKISYEFFDGFMDKLEDMLSCSNTKALNKETDGATSNNVLIWADINSNLLKKILKKTDPERKYNFVVLEAPSDILKQKNINSYYAIIFIDVDMDRLGDSEKKVKSVNDLIVKYVDDGGLFIATHDIVFKKMRNEGIIEMTGLWTNYFEAVERVKYIKQPICDEIGMFKSLPNEFDLGDAEECWGANSPDNINYFVSDKGRSLVVGNDYGDGAWFWLNTGDAREYPPETILKNETNFSLLIKDALEYRKIMNQP